MKVFFSHVANIEGSRPDWCISSMTYSRDTPFWSGTLNIIPRQTVKRTHDHKKKKKKKKNGTEDPRFYRQQRRPARHAKHGLAHALTAMSGQSVLTKHSWFSQEKLYKLKLLAQHDKRKSPSVMWQISFPDKPWNEHTTTKTSGTEDPRFYREQRRAAPHAQHWLAHDGCKRAGVSGWRVG